MKYYTSKGDAGTTTLFSCPKGVRISKGNDVFEVLGGLDELNSFVGLCRATARRASFPKMDASGRSEFLNLLRAIQEDLFIIQAECAGAVLRLSDAKIKCLEETMKRFAEKFPPILSFVIPGATELGARLDVARAVSRRVERVYIRQKQNDAARNPAVGVYLNRLSSLFYVLARYANHAQDAVEQVPSYH